MSDDHHADMLRWLMAGWHERMKRGDIGPSCCILATRTGLAVLEELDVHAEPFPCQVVVANAEGWPLIEAHVPTWEWPKSAHSIGVGYGSDEPMSAAKGFDGHMMIRSGAWLVDLSAPQYHRPGKLHFTHPQLLGWAGDITLSVDNLGQRLYVERLDTKVYRQSPDWRRNWKPLVDDVMAGMLGYAESGADL